MAHYWHQLKDLPHYQPQLLPKAVSVSDPLVEDRVQRDAHEAAAAIPGGDYERERSGQPQLIILLLLFFYSDINNRSAGREDAKTVQVLLHIRCNHPDIPVRIEPVQLMLLLVEVDDGLCLAVEDLQPLGDGLLVIVGPAAGLAAFEESLLKFLLSALEVDD